MAAEGLITVPSKYPASETMSRLKSEIAGRGLVLFTTVDHAKNADEVGMMLPPTTLFIFGNAKAGTPLMQSNQTVGIDLPLKALVWQNHEGGVFVSYNDPSWIGRRHDLPQPLETATSRMRALLDGIAQAACQGQ